MPKKTKKVTDKDQARYIKQRNAGSLPWDLPGAESPVFQKSSPENTVRIILRHCETSIHGETVSEEFRTVEISSDEIERLLAGTEFKPKFSVIGAELINPSASRKKYQKEEDELVFEDDDPLNFSL